MHYEQRLDARRIRERNRLRAIIVEQKLIPDVLIHRRKKYWDGISLRTPEGSRIFGTAFATGLQLQAKKMAREGTWGDLRRLVLSWNRHGELREALEGKRRRGTLSGVSFWNPTKHRAKANSGKSRL
jgi:hypothetical protein